MKKLYFFLFSCCFAIESYGQSTTCASATTLTPGALGAGCTATTGTLGGFATTIRCSITTREGFYQFTATSSNHTVIVDGNNNVDIIVSVGTGCASITDLANCTNASNINNDIENIVLTGLTIGANYFIAVRNANTAPNDNNNNNGFTICVTTPADGDNCANAISLTPNASCITTAGDNQLYANGTVGCGTRFRDGWFSFTATQANHNVTVDGASRFQAVVGVFTTCAATTSPTGGACATATAEDEVITSNLTGLTIGVTYFIQVYNNSEYTGTNNNRHQYTICVTSPPLPPANDLCTTPIVLTHQTLGSCTTTAGTVAGATQSLAGCTGTADDDVWYSFTATSATAEVRVNAAMDEVVEIFSGTCAGLTSLVCQDTPEGSVIVSGLTVSQVYLVRVYSWSSTVQATPTFTICITTPVVPANNDCGGAVALTHETFGNCTLTAATVANATQSLVGCTGTANDDVWFSFVATSANAEVKVTWVQDEVVQIYSGTCGGLTSIICQDTPEGSVLAGSLTIGNTYFVRVYDFSATVSASPSFTICVTTPAVVVNNDECTNPVILTHQTAGSCTSQTFDINGKTVSEPACSGSPSPLRDAWFKFTATATSAIIHRVTTFRSVIQVFNGGAAPGACGGTSLDCYNPTEVWSGQQGDLQINGLTVGNVYFFRLYPTSSTLPSPSTYSLCISTPATIVNTECTDMRPACSNSTIVFQAQTGGTAPAGNNYGCLSSRPNPSWFYMQVGTPGTLTFSLGASADIDFAAWGPYTSLSNAVTACGTLPAPIACSYATAKTETVNITGATTGQVYVLLVTNYANVNQIIDVRQTSGTGTSDCSIVLSAELNKLTAEAKGTNNVISWNTATNNPNIKGFEVHKSLNGRNFSLATYIAHTQNNAYTFVEESPACKDVYYQIITLYEDGRKQPSHVVSVLRRQGECPHLVQVYPNPAQKNLTIKLLQNSQSSSAYTLADTKGKTYLVGKIPKETHKYDLDLAEVPKGLYILKVCIANQWIYEKIVKE